MCGRLQAVKDFPRVAALWSWQPCVRPFNAVHMTAGHNAFRGPGPGQKLALTMLWPEWVVPIPGSTGSALRAESPFQPFIHAVAGAIPFNTAWPYRAIAIGSL